MVVDWAGLLEQLLVARMVGKMVVSSAASSEKKWVAAWVAPKAVVLVELLEAWRVVLKVVLLDERMVDQKACWKAAPKVVQSVDG